MSIRFGQAMIGDHLRLSRNKAFAITMSLRMTTVRASFPGFPARMSKGTLVKQRWLQR
jgi:hypothetical protein